MESTFEIAITAGALITIGSAYATLRHCAKKLENTVSKDLCDSRVTNFSDRLNKIEKMLETIIDKL